MKTLTFLQEVIQGKRSVIITCVESCLDIEQRMDGNVFRYTALGNMIDLNSDLQKQNILNFINFKKCSKIIVAGHADCTVLDSILSCREPAITALGSAKETLQSLHSNNHLHLLQNAVSRQVMIEQNIIAQCIALSQFAPITRKLREGIVEVIGLVLNPSGENKKVFSHQFPYNTITTMN